MARPDLKKIKEKKRKEKKTHTHKPTPLGPHLTNGKHSVATVIVSNYSGYTHIIHIYIYTQSKAAITLISPIYLSDYLHDIRKSGKQSKVIYLQFLIYSSI